MRVTREKVLTLASKHNLLLDIEKPTRPWYDWHITAWAPYSKTFVGGCHCDCRMTGEGIGATSRGIPWDEVYDLLQEIIQEGFESCKEAAAGDCEYCGTYHELVHDLE
jgi:hypothetical protein